MGFIFGLFILFFLAMVHKTIAGTFAIDYPNKMFVKDGQPYQYLSAEMHYFRIHPDYWDDRLYKVRAAGLNAIQTYVAWNLHEPQEGVFDFSGIVNITRYFDLAQKHDLNVLLRAGPSITAEFTGGGMPYWLAKYDGMKVRSMNANFTKAVRNFYTTFMPILKPYLYQNGGPVLMVQFENEYGIFGCDHNYTDFLRDLFWELLGNDTVLYTTDNGPYVKCGHANNTFATFDFGTQPANHTYDSWLEDEQNFNGGGPKVDSEFYPGWFVSWGDDMSNFTNFPNHSLVLQNIAYLFSVNTSITTSYDYNSPVREWGEITPLYEGIRSFVQTLPNWKNQPLALPTGNKPVNYGQVTMKRIGNGLIQALNLILETCQSGALRFFEINHGFLFVLYTTTLQSGGTLVKTLNIGDYGYVFLNNVFQGMISDPKEINLTTKAQPGDVLRIVVEERGRCDWGCVDPKGLGGVQLDDNWISNWTTCGVNLTEASINSLSNNFLSKLNLVEENNPSNGQALSLLQPGVFLGTFTATTINDTFLDPTGWSKGQLFVNGFNLGRYWPVKGPQITLYVPKVLLRQTNTIVLIELVGTNQSFVNLIDTPKLW